MSTTYSYDEVYSECLNYFNQDSLAASVCVSKYLLKNQNGEYLEKSPEDIFKRLATELSRIEKNYKNPLSYEQIYDQLKGFKKIVLGGSAMAGIGNNEKAVSISNCFVIPSPTDSYGGILKADQEIVQIAKRRGGVGLDISNIRPKGLSVKNAAQTTDGIEVFMERFSNSTKEVAQNGRRGALIETIHVKHPQILDFIKIKRDKNKVNSANISIKFTDEFFECLSEGKMFTLQFPVDVPKEQAKIITEIDPKIIWKEFVKSNWMGAEPGILYWDTIVKKSIADCYAANGYQSTTCNPCAELVMQPYGICLLSSLNLSSFIKNPFTLEAYFDEIEFTNSVQIATRLMDDMIDLELEKINIIIEKINGDPEDELTKAIELNVWKKVKESLQNGRRVGLGVTGLADMIAKMNLAYGSQKSINLCDDVFTCFHKENMRMQVKLAEDRGPFSCWDFKKEKDNWHIELLESFESKKDIYYRLMKYGRRNIGQTTIAPNGSISILTQTSSGIEPVFKNSYIRRKKFSSEDEKNGLKPSKIDNDGIKWTEYEVFHPGVLEWMKITKEKDITKSPYYKCEAGDINWKDRIKLQSFINNFIQASISSTINLPKNTTEEQISEIYLEAWKSGCKGITIYREGSRDGVLISKEDQKKDGDIVYTNSPKRPEVLPVHVYRSSVKGEGWIFLVGILNDKPFEVFGGKESCMTIPNKYVKGLETKNV